MPLIDTHCHLDFSVFADGLSKLIADSVNQGVQGFVVPATTKESWARIIELSKKYHEVRFALGLHPYFIEQHEESGLEKLSLLLSDQFAQCVAVGEIGLDAKAGNLKQQEYFFAAQLEVARVEGLPVILHSRAGHNNMIRLLKSGYPQGRGVIHGFSGSAEEALGLWKAGYHIGVGGVITWPRASKTRKAIQSLPLESIVLETDAPDMPLFGQAEVSNTPLNILKIFKSLAALRFEPEEQIMNQLWANSESIFGQWEKT